MTLQTCRYCDEDGELLSLQRAFRLFRLLLLYADPPLAARLDACDFAPELYATSWLLTLFSRNLDLPLVNRVWDALFGSDDPAFVSCLLAALLIKDRERLLAVERSHQVSFAYCYAKVLYQQCSSSTAPEVVGSTSSVLSSAAQ
jgi:Rab-GTPase-TBC domain